MGLQRVRHDLAIQQQWNLPQNCLSGGREGKAWKHLSSVSLPPLVKRSTWVFPSTHSHVSPEHLDGCSAKLVWGNEPWGKMKVFYDVSLMQKNWQFAPVQNWPTLWSCSFSSDWSRKCMCVWVVGKRHQSVYKRILLYHIRLFLLENSGLISEQAQRALLFTLLLSVSNMSNLQSTDWILATLLFGPHFCWWHQGSVISFELSAYLMVRLRLGCREKVNLCLVSEFKSQLLEGSAVEVPTLN